MAIEPNPFVKFEVRDINGAELTFYGPLNLFDSLAEFRMWADVQVYGDLRIAGDRRVTHHRLLRYGPNGRILTVTEDQHRDKPAQQRVHAVLRAEIAWFDAIGLPVHHSNEDQWSNVRVLARRITIRPGVQESWFELSWPIGWPADWPTVWPNVWPTKWHASWPRLWPTHWPWPIYGPL